MMIVRKITRRKPWLAGLFSLFMGFSALHAQETSVASVATVAVAANFAQPAKEIAARFAAESPHKVSLVVAASGQTEAQIRNAAPYDVWLSADSVRPRRLIDDGFAVAGTAFPYAVGVLVVWSKNGKRVTGQSSLVSPAILHVAIANRHDAPYGAAAVEAMTKLGVWGSLESKIVEPESVGQAFALADSHNAEIAFVALSQALASGEGSRWVVPQDYYTPLVQTAVLLKHGENNPAAQAFLAFLKGPEASEIIKRAGYNRPSEP